MAHIQGAQTSFLIPIILSIVGTAVAIYNSYLKAKDIKIKTEENMALREEKVTSTLKEYVKQENKTMELEIKNINKDVRRLEHNAEAQEKKIEEWHKFLEKIAVLIEKVNNINVQNEKEHKEFKNLFKSINSKLDNINGNLKKVAV